MWHTSSISTEINIEFPEELNSAERQYQIRQEERQSQPKPGRDYD
jgi:hypothetical protein